MNDVHGGLPLPLLEKRLNDQVIYGLTCGLYEQRQHHILAGCEPIAGGLSVDCPLLYFARKRVNDY
jgi:hypothetical protein